MEEAETEEQTLDWIRLGRFFDFLPVKGLISSQHVLFQTAWRLEGHLDRVLQDRHWEGFARHGCHPESEVSMVAVVEVLNNVVKFWHERRCQMAVHEQSPSSSTCILVDAVGSFLVLTSTQGDSLELLGHVHLFCKPQEVSNWIRTWRQYEDERHGY